MKVRLIGPAREMGTWVDLLRTVSNVRRVSRAHQAGHAAGLNDVRVYVTADLYGEGDDPDPSAPRCPWCRLPYALDQHGPAKGGMSWSCRRCRRMFVHAGDGSLYLAEAVNVATIQVGDLALLPGGWRVAVDVQVGDDEVRVRTGHASDPVAGHRLLRVLTRRAERRFPAGSTYEHKVYVVREGQQPEVGL